MPTKLKITLFALLLLFGAKAYAAEGMWMPDEKGELSPLLRNATVMFDDMCSGVIVSPNGLFLTNHHCALDAIRSQSTLSHNWVQEGFAAGRLSDEIPIPGLNVKHLLYSAELTGRMDAAVWGIEDESARLSIIESVVRSVCDSIENGSPFLAATVAPFYEGNRWFLQVYEVFRDIRLVLAPPYSIAAFGGETDNWTGPRCSADFAFLRIYADTANRPACYSPKNKPLKTTDYARISTRGYNASDTMMTVGFPGTTQRYATSWEVEAIKVCENEPRIAVMAKKLTYWQAAMEKDAAVKLAYSSKYAQYANFYKYAVGMNRCIDSLHVIEAKQQQEEQLLNWIAQDSVERGMYRDALYSIKRSVLDKIEEQKALTYLTDALTYEGPEVVSLVWTFIDSKIKDDKAAQAHFLEQEAHPFYNGYNIALDKAVLAEMLPLAKECIPGKYLPAVFDTIQIRYSGNIKAYVDDVFKKTAFRSERTLKKALQKKDGAVEIENDPLYNLTTSVRTARYNLFSELNDAEYSRTKGGRILFQGREAFAPEHDFYSNANFTMRKSFGVITPLSSGGFYTTPKDLFDKLATQKPEYTLSPRLKTFFETAPDSLHLCFISDNDITGGNSGSPVFNADGELTGLAFDGNWEGMSGDLLFGAEQRTIHVDIRYILFIVKNWAKAKRVYREIVP